MAKKTNTNDTRLAYYKEMKQKHPDTILIFHSGSFYKTYDADASIVASILGITLTKDRNINVAAFPHHALDTYLPKLIRAGKQAAICDPMPEDEKAVETEEPAQEEEPQEQGEKQPEDMTIAELMAAYKALKEENRQLKEAQGKAQHWMDKYQNADNHLRKVLESLSGYEFETGQ